MIVVAIQYAMWFAGQILRIRFEVRYNRPEHLFSRDQHCLIVSPTHKTVLDPWLLIIALGFHEFRTFVPIRILATQTFGPRLKWLQWFMPLIRLLYRLAGVIELPAENDDGFPGGKIRGLLAALDRGEAVVIFPEGGIWRKQQPPIGDFAPGVTYLQRKSGAAILPIAVWMSQQTWPRRRYVAYFGRPVQIPENFDLHAGAAWLRERVLELYEHARKEEER